MIGPNDYVVVIVTIYIATENDETVVTPFYLTIALVPP